MNGTEHQAWEYSPTLYDSYPCLSAIEDVFPNGTNLTIAVDPNDPSSHQAFELALMTEVDEDHQGFRTGYRESSHLEWGGYGRAVLVTTCSMDAAVAYTFDGEHRIVSVLEASVTVMVDTENPSEGSVEDPTTDVVHRDIMGGPERAAHLSHGTTGYRGRHRRRHHGAWVSSRGGLQRTTSNRRRWPVRWRTRSSLNLCSDRKGHVDGDGSTLVQRKWKVCPSEARVTFTDSAMSGDIHHTVVNNDPAAVTTAVISALSSCTVS